MGTRVLTVEPLTREAFEPFGRVIDVRGQAPEVINEGHTRKFGDLLPLDCDAEGGRVAVHLYRSNARELPIEIRVLERHPLGSQAFWPLQQKPFIVVVAPPGEAPDETAIRAFITDGRQAIQFHRGTWHHYQISLGEECDYLVIDREGPGDNCEEVTLTRPLTIAL